ncbi:MAG TPA: flagellar motor protein MotB [Steroidobacteraceae bacterium]|nr:flagellar motor protein MotB [Steroidobacteraceae bacterium]
MNAPQGERPILIVKRPKKAGNAHHGGAWKVAYADFVTAMMAFFMVMWLIASVSKEERAAIFEYFKNPSMQQGKSPRASMGQMGPGGASTSVINLRGALDARKSASALSTGLGTPRDTPVTVDKAAPEVEEAKKIASEADRKKLESLMAQLREAIDHSQALKPFKDQLLLDITPEGLRIQIVDSQNRPMFDLGSAKLKDYTYAILHELAPYLNSVPNRISLSGHTDTTAYVATGGYTNWDLSADRANAARRALEGGGLALDKVSRVVGLSSSVLFDKENSRNPINRRISIIVMTKEADESALKTDAMPESSAARAATTAIPAGANIDAPATAAGLPESAPAPPSAAAGAAVGADAPPGAPK